MSGANRRASRGFIQTSVSDSCREGYSDLCSNGAFPEQTLHICAGKIGYCSVSNASRKAGVISSSLIAGSSEFAGQDMCCPDLFLSNRPHNPPRGGIDYA